MKTSSDKKSTEEAGIATWNAIVQKASGNFYNLNDDDIRKLQQLCSREISDRLREKYGKLYPGMNPLVAILRDEPYRLRTTQRVAAQRLGISHTHYHKIITGHDKVGLDVARRIYCTLELDGNFILENL